MFKLIIFDLDGVLIDSLGNMQYAWNKICKKNNINKSFNNFKKLIGLPFIEILKKLDIDKKKFRLIEKNYNYFSLQKINSVKIKKKDLKILKDLIKNGYKLALFTSKNFSLFCTVFNACAAVTCFSNGSPGFGVLCLGFAGLCARNYWNAK